MAKQWKYSKDYFKSRFILVGMMSLNFNVFCVMLFVILF